MRIPLQTASILIVLGSCAPLQAPPAPAPALLLTRATTAGPAEATAAGAGALQRLGLPVSTLDAPSGVVRSDPIIVQTTWAGEPVSARLLCGAPTSLWLTGSPAPYDRRRLLDLTQRLPITVQVELTTRPRLGGGTTTLAVHAAADRPRHAPIGAEQIACVPTVRLVEELFGIIAGAG
jgi:hypothetical protein